MLRRGRLHSKWIVTTSRCSSDTSKFLNQLRPLTVQDKNNRSLKSDISRISSHIPQFFREFRREAILYCRDINKLYFVDMLSKRFCENANANCGMWANKLITHQKRPRAINRVKPQYYCLDEHRSPFHP